jgi:hypothetical protein
MGAEVSPAAKEAYLHLWTVAGDLLGISEVQRLRNSQDADRLATDLQASLQGPSPEGVCLMKVLLDEMECAMPLGWLRAPRTLVRFLAGNNVADMLAVPKAAWWSPLLSVAASLSRRLNRSPVARRIGFVPSQLVGRRIIQLWIDQHLRGERHPFMVTAGQRRGWRLADDEGAVTELRRWFRTRRQRLREAHMRIPRRDAPQSLGA